MGKMSLKRELSRRLRKIKPHLAVILQGALKSARDTRNHLRYANAANVLRELLRGLFEELAPNEEIKDCHWFKPDSTAKNGITRKHRVLFSIYGYVDRGLFPRNFSVKVDSLATRITRQIGSLSKLVHITEKTLKVPPTEADRLLLSTLRLYLTLLKTTEKSKEIFLEELSMILSEELDEIFINEVFVQLDIRSSHTRPQYAEDVYVKIEDIDKDTIFFSGDGSILCQLKYGSDPLHSL